MRPFSTPLRASLRVRLLGATVALVALALGIALVAFERAAQKVIVETLGDHLAARTREVLDAALRFQKERCMAVRGWAESDAMQGTLDTGDPKFAEDYLRRAVQDQGGAITTVVLLDTRADVRAAVRAAGPSKRRGEALEHLRGRRIAGLRAAVLALRGEPVAVSIAPSSVLDPGDQSGTTLFVAVPVKDFVGDLVGAVVAAVPPAALSRLLADIAGEDRSYVPFVADDARRLVLSLPLVGRDRLAEGLLDGRATVLERHLGVDGEPLLVVRSAVSEEPPRWRAMMMVPEREAFQARAAMRRFLAGCFAAVLVGAALAGVVAIRRASRPRRDIAASMARVSGGDLSTRLPEVYADDLGHLVHAFNVMVSEVARSRDELKRREALQREMEIAHRIQTAILPARTAVAGFDVAGAMKTADDVGGDLYDLLVFEDTFWIVIGDVSGHGINSGLVMMMAQAAAAAAIGDDPHRSPREVVAAVNRVVNENVHRRMGRDDYLTLMVARHLGDGRFVSAGAHQPVFIVREGGAVEVVEHAGPWVGVVEDVGRFLVESAFHLARGDALCLITDGIVEAKDARDALYGEERLAAVLAATAGRGDAASALSGIFSSVEQFAPVQDDDRTAIVVRRTHAEA